jgi:hypothetical protein
MRYRHILCLKSLHILFVPLVEKELHTLPGHLSSSPVFSGVRVTRSLVLCVLLCRSLFVLLFFFLLSFFLLTIMLSVLLRFMDSDYSIGIDMFFIKHILMSMTCKCVGGN